MTVISLDSRHGTMPFTIRHRDNRTAAKVKIRVAGIAIRPATSFWAKRKNLFGGGEAGVGTVHGELFRRRLDKERSERLRFGAIVYPGGARNGDPLGVSNGHYSRSQKAQHNVDPAWHTAITALPPPHAPRADAK
jgi:hypothetical protein